MSLLEFQEQRNQSNDSQDHEELYEYNITDSKDFNNENVASLESDSEKSLIWNIIREILEFNRKNGWKDAPVLISKQPSIGVNSKEVIEITCPICKKNVPISHKTNESTSEYKNHVFNKH